MTKAELLFYNGVMKFVAIIASTIVIHLEADNYKAAVKEAVKAAAILSEKHGVHYSVEQVQNE